MTIEIKTAAGAQGAIHEDSVQVRTTVFIKEQGVPAELEVDDDEDRCVYLVAYDRANQATTDRVQADSTETNVSAGSGLGSSSETVDAGSGQPVGTLRLLTEDSGRLHIQRVAVLADYRQRGVGRQLIEAAFDYARAHGSSDLILGAQLSATGFYAKLGFQYTDRPEFLDAGIRHREMSLQLD